MMAGIFMRYKQVDKLRIVFKVIWKNPNRYSNCCLYSVSFVLNIIILSQKPRQFK